MKTELAISQSQTISARLPLPAPVSSRNARRPSPLRLACQYLAVAGLGLASYFFVSHFIIQSVQVVGVSMLPTLRNADHYFLNRWIYHLHPPQRCDVVVLRDPTDGSYVVKRVIAMPGDLVYLKRGVVYVNGRKLKEPYLMPGTSTFTLTKSPEEIIKCGADQYFVLGDNRNCSLDSRTYGPVPRQNILGALIFF